MPADAAEARGSWAGVRPASVVVTDVAWPDVERESELLSEAGAVVRLAETGEEAELLELTRDAVAILTCWKRVSEDVIRSAEGLLVVGRYGVGVDNIAVEAATERGVIVTNVPGFCADELAEHALALVFALVRRPHAFDAEIRAGRWSPVAEPPLRRLRGRTLGIVGLGAAGQALAGRAAGLGLEVLAAVRTGRTPPAQVRAVALEELAERSDVVSLHVPLTAETRGLVDAAFLARMRRDAYLVNTSRGAVVDSGALAAALHEGRIAGAALDVTDPEPLPAGHPLLSAPNLLLTPHVGFSSVESLETLKEGAAGSVADVLCGRRPEHIVNPEVLAHHRWRALA